MTGLLKVIGRLVTELQGRAGAEALRNREDGAGPTGNDDGVIHTKDRAVHTKDVPLHVHNEYGVVPAASFSVAGLVCLPSINGAAAIEGMNQNNTEGANFSAVVDSDLSNSGAGNQRTSP